MCRAHAARRPAPPLPHASARLSIIDRTPLARFGAPEEIAEAVHFLSSVTWMTGQTVYVDGGFLASGLAYFGQARAKLTGESG